MRYLSLLLIWLGLTAPLLAQRNPDSTFVEAKLKAKLYNGVAFLEDPDRSDEGSTLLFSGKDFLAFWDIDKDFSKFTETSLIPSEAILGVAPGSSMLPMAHYTDGGRVIVLAQYKPPASVSSTPVSLYFFEYNPVDKSIDAKKSITLMGRTTIHATLSLGGEIWLLTSHATSDNLVIRRFHGLSGTSDSTLIDLKASGLVAEPSTKKKETAIGQALREIGGLTVFYPETDRHLSNGLVPNKLYISSEKISLLLYIENLAIPSKLFLLEIDRISFKPSLYNRKGVFNFKHAELSGDFIITLAASEAKTTLTWWHKDSLKAIKTYTLLPSDSVISFINQEPIQEKQKLSNYALPFTPITKESTRIIAKPSQIVRKLANNSERAVVATLQKDGKLKVTFGAYSELVQNYNFNNQFMFNPVHNPALRPPVPTSFGRFGPAPLVAESIQMGSSEPSLIGTPIRASGASKIVILDGLFDPATGEHLSGEVEANPYDMPYNRIDVGLSFVQTFCFYTEQNKLYLVYYDKSQKGVWRIAYPR